MARAWLFLTDGFEEVEALGTLDVLRRGGVEAASVSLTGESLVTGSHGISVKADMLYEELGSEEADMLILPGGPGTTDYKKHQPLLNLIKRYCEENRYVGAICAAPSILGGLGLLSGKKAVCYPGFEKELVGAKIGSGLVEVDGNIITSKGPGTALLFGLTLLERLQGSSAAEKIKKDMEIYECV